MSTDRIIDRNQHSDVSVGAPLVELQQMTKAYPGCLANDQISLDLQAGCIHALLGENGAGKSTLVKMLYGLLKPDAGVILWQGQSVEIVSPAMARELGIAMVFQHFSLFDALTVMENIALGMGINASDHLRQRITDVSARYGLALDPDRSVYALSVGERQRVEIIRCLLQQPKLLIMDEPTSVLTPQEVQDLFVTLRRLAENGMAILYISHKLNEIRSLCSAATILRDGRKVAETDPREQSAASLAALMMGNELPAASRRLARTQHQPVLELKAMVVPVKNQHSGIRLSSATLTVHAGEIVGIAGVAGNGQDELLAALAGEQLAERSEQCVMNGRHIGRRGPGERRQMGLCCVPEERLGHSAVPGLSLQENTFLTGHYRRKLHRFGFISKRAQPRVCTNDH